MEGCLSLSTSLVPFRGAVKTVLNRSRHRRKFTVKSCSAGLEGEDAAVSAYSILGVHPTCSSEQLKAAFQAKVKQFHPDLNRKEKGSDTMIRRVIQAECLDPFDNPECEALDVFVNEALCVGKGCPYSCVQKAPHAFAHASSGTAIVTSQGHGDDYLVQLAVGQCPSSCIHYVTPSQRIVLEELLNSILSSAFNASAEADLLYSIIVKARFENNRFRRPKKQPKASTEHVEWF